MDNERLKHSVQDMFRRKLKRNCILNVSNRLFIELAETKVTGIKAKYLKF